MGRAKALRWVEADVAISRTSWEESGGEGPVGPAGCGKEPKMYSEVGNRD